MARKCLSRPDGQAVIKELGYDAAFAWLQDHPGTLAKINLLVDWTVFRPLLDAHLQRRYEGPGGAAFDTLTLFKMLLIGTLRDLSDRGLERHLRDSIEAHQFLGIPIGSPIPCYSTFSNFRRAVTENGGWDKLMAAFRAQLEAHGIVDIKHGVVVDATVVEQPRRPSGRKVFELAEDRCEEARSAEDQARETEYYGTLRDAKPGVDDEARWTRKGEWKFGDKHHVATDCRGLVLGLVTTAANVADTTQLAAVLDVVAPPPGTRVYADKGYASGANQEHLHQRRLKDGIMRKAQRNRPLGERARRRNGLISKVRYVVERTFGGIARWMHGGRCRYKGIAATHGQGVLEAIAYNMYRLPGLVTRVA